MTRTDSKAVRPARLLRFLALAAALCGVLFAASLVSAPPASAEDVTIWSADLDVKTLNTAQDEFGCSESGPFNGQCINSNVLSDDDFKLHGTTYTIRRIEDDGSDLKLTLNALLPENVLKILTLNLDDDTELAFDDASVSSSNKRYTWDSSPSWSSGDDVDLSITDSSGPSLVRNTSLAANDRNLFENGHRSAQAFTAGTWARVTSIGIGIGDEVDDDVEVTLHKGGGSNPGDRLKRLSNPSSITENSVNVFTVPDDGIVLEASKTYFVQVVTTSSDRVAVSVTVPQSDGNDEDAGGAKNWTIDNDSSTNRPSIGAWQESNQSMRIDVKGQVLLPPPTNPSARAVAPMRVTLEWDRTLPSLTGAIDRDDGYKIEWSADGNAPWTSLVNYTNQHGTFDIWCVCYPTRYNDDTITPGTTRHYRIKAVDDDDESPWSDVVSVTTPGLVESDQGKYEFGAVVSTLDSFTDQKVFRFDLDANERYRFRISGRARVIVTGPFSTEVMNEVLEPNNGLKPRFTTQAEGEYQVKISHGGNLSAGRFHFILVPESEPGLSELTFGPGEGPDDVVLNTYGDTDRFGLRVQPGKAYRVRVVGKETAPFLTAATPRIKRANPPSIYTDHNMGKPWVDGVTNSVICPEHGQMSRDCEEFQAFVIDLRGLSGAQQTWHIDVSGTQRPDTRPYRVGTYAVGLLELSSSQLQGVRMPLRAWFAAQPAQHDGSTRIKVRVAFSDVVDESPQNVGEHGVSVDGGEVTSVRPVDGQATGGSAERKRARSAGGQDEGPEDREVVWELEIEPDSDGDVTVSLAAWRPCDEPGAICTADGRTLSTAISTTVRGPDEAAAPEPPDKPRNLSATASHNSVTLTWDDPGDDSITGYVILRRVRVNIQGGDFSVLIADTGSAATTYTDNEVAASTTYTYRIKAINEHGVSERSRWVHIDTPAPPVPDKPTGLEATVSNGQVVLTWDDPDDDSITGYVILRRVRVNDQGGDFRELVANTGSAATTYIDDNVAASTTYTYRIKAINGHGVSERSAWFHIDTSPAPEPVNSPATGASTISGTAQVGETLTANTSGIADADGLDNATFAHQWLADDSEIEGATNATYTLGDAEEGQVIKVRVSFTDDAGNAESLTSAATDAVAAVLTPNNSPATEAPTINGTTQVGEVLEVNTSGIADADGLANTTFGYQWLADDTDIAGATGLTYILAPADEGKSISVRVSFTDDAGNEETLTSAATDVVLAAPASTSPATGVPTISGTARVGETLTANTSGIADADGLSNVQYEYQWLADDADIAGATNATYTLVDADEGKAISVSVSFTDDAGNDETLTSAATAAVAGAQPTEPPDKPTGLEATATHDSVTLTWDDPGDDSITGYVILRRIPGVDPEGQFDELVADTGTAVTSYIDDTVSAETRYTYRIKAINGYGTSERSRWVHIDVPAAPEPEEEQAAEPPDKPTGLEATASHGQVTLTWDDPGDDSITGYVILRRVRVNDQGGDFDVLVADTASAATSYTDDSVAAGLTYTYRIKAINEHGTSERSRWYHIDIPEAP